MEFAIINQVADSYRYVTIDTEFSGLVYKTIRHPRNLSPEQRYSLVKANVDNLKLIQLGITLSNRDSDNSMTWEFNFRGFDPEIDSQDPSSIELLKLQGIDFLKNKTEGNVISYTPREAPVDEIKKQSLVYGVSLAKEAIEEVSCEERLEQLVDWMEEHKVAGKWIETVEVGLGALIVLINSFLPFQVELDFQFGSPVMALPWVRPARLASGSFTVLRSPKSDGPSLSRSQQRV
ncbi:putative CCR4-associated factor 1 11 [Carex littledalei]|uniref:poly(A)-specific ribonuclease n=1 Tax=Carex littledalei TaxID=544730 RepID=A0A833RLF6_9POAL|nr:putative CCR4-associated factor 1 11 [Carex littledalei]